MKKTILSYDFSGKKVLLRLDLNVPIADKKITSNKRLVETLPTLKYLLNSGARVIILSHLGRPEGIDKKYSLKPVCVALSELLGKQIAFCPEIIGEKTQKAVDKLKNGDCLMLENVRFDSREEQCDENFSKQLSSLADIFVLDAFGTAHRKHCSTYGVAKLLPNAMGFLVNKELTYINDAIQNPKRPFVAILGGAKISDKIALIDNLLDKVDTILIGGGMSFTFLKALKGEVGKSLVDDSQIEVCYNIVKKALNKKIKILLPTDCVVADNISEPKIVKNVKITNIADDMIGLDIGSKTIKLFSKQIKKARTVFWNGPMGVFENKYFENGTKQIALAISKNKKCVSIVGGGDSASAVEKYNLQDKFSHISTGGGASLKLLEGKSLPCVEILNNEKE